jgi:hypothetical protein
MRPLVAAIGFLTLASSVPAWAGTLEEITTHGMVVTISDMDFDLTFTPDGKYTGMAGQLTGTWKIDGDKLCTNSNFDPTVTCVAYPKDKKSGDTFEVTGDQGSAKVKIK